MPNLQSFTSVTEAVHSLYSKLLTPKVRWADSSCEEACDTALIVSDAEIISALKGCQTLKSLLIQFESQWPGDKSIADKCWIPLEGFRNLTSLELYNFYGTEAPLIREITGVLVNSPNLKTLGLGLLCDCDAEMLLEQTILEGECEFLENLCLRFQS